MCTRVFCMDRSYSLQYIMVFGVAGSLLVNEIGDCGSVGAHDTIERLETLAKPGVAFKAIV